jgi:hypothetical protein
MSVGRKTPVVCESHLQRTALTAAEPSTPRALNTKGGRACCTAE